MISCRISSTKEWSLSRSKRCKFIISFNFFLIEIHSCGTTYTQKLEDKLKDIHIANTNKEDFETYVKKHLPLMNSEMIHVWNSPVISIILIICLQL